MTPIWPLMALLYLAHTVEVEDLFIDCPRLPVISFHHGSGTQSGSAGPDLDYIRNLRWGCPHHSCHRGHNDLESGEVGEKEIKIKILRVFF